MCLSARHPSACLFQVSASGAIIPAATANSRRLSQQNPYKTCVSLVELGRTSRHFIVHFEKIPTKKFPRYRRCATCLVFPCVVLGFPFNDSPPPRGASTPVPRRATPRPPLAEMVIGARSFAVTSEGFCVGRAWSHREAAGGLVKVGSRSCFLGML